MSVRFLVVDETAIRGVPFELTIEFMPNRDKLAHRGGASSIEEVLERSQTITNAEGKVVGDIRGAAGITTNFDRIKGIHLLTVTEFAFGSDEGNVVRSVPRVIHLNAVFENGADIVGTVVSARENLDGLFRVETKRVHGAAKLVSAPVGEESVAVFGVITPTAAVAAGATFAVVRRERRLSLPTIPIHALRNRLLGEVAVPRRIAQTDVNFFDFADATALENRSDVPVVFHNALAAACADAIVLARGLDDQTGFLKGQSQGLFAVDVFTGAASLDGDLRVPVIGSGADDSVDVFAIKGVFVMRVTGGVFVPITLIDTTFGVVKVGFIAVAYA